MFKTLRTHFVAGFKAGYNGMHTAPVQVTDDKGTLDTTATAVETPSRSTRVGHKVGRSITAVATKAKSVKANVSKVLDSYGWKAVKVITAGLLVGCFLMAPLTTLLYVIIGLMCFRGMLLLFALSYTLVDAVL